MPLTIRFSLSWLRGIWLIHSVCISTIPSKTCLIGSYRLFCLGLLDVAAKFTHEQGVVTSIGHSQKPKIKTLFKVV